MIPLIPIFIGLYVWNKMSDDQKGTTAGVATAGAAGIGFTVLINLALVIGAAIIGWKLYKRG